MQENHPESGAPLNQNEETGPSVDANQTDEGSGQKSNVSETTNDPATHPEAEAPTHGNLLETSSEATTETKEYSHADGSHHPSGPERLKSVQCKLRLEGLD